MSEDIFIDFSKVCNELYKDDVSKMLKKDIKAKFTDIGFNGVMADFATSLIKGQFSMINEEIMAPCDIPPAIEESSKDFLQQATDNIGNDYSEPVVINDFVIKEINYFGQVKSDNLPQPETDKYGDFVATKLSFEYASGQKNEVDVKIICSGKAWYLVLPEMSIEQVLLTAKDIEHMLDNPEEYKEQVELGMQLLNVQ